MTGVDKNHALALYFLSKMGNEVGTEKAKQYEEDYLKILKKSNKWSYFFDELGLRGTPTHIQKEKFAFNEFKAGREMN